MQRVESARRASESTAPVGRHRRDPGRPWHEVQLCGAGGIWGREAALLLVDRQGGLADETTASVIGACARLQDAATVPGVTQCYRCLMGKQAYTGQSADACRSSGASVSRVASETSAFTRKRYALRRPEGFSPGLRADHGPGSPAEVVPGLELLRVVCEERDQRSSRGEHEPGEPFVGLRWATAEPMGTALLAAGGIHGVHDFGRASAPAPR